MVRCAMISASPGTSAAPRTLRWLHRQIQNGASGKLQDFNAPTPASLTARPPSLRVPNEIFRRVTCARMKFSARFKFGVWSNTRTPASILVRIQPTKQIVETGMAGLLPRRERPGASVACFPICHGSSLIPGGSATAVPFSRPAFTRVPACTFVELFNAASCHRSASNNVVTSSSAPTATNGKRLLSGGFCIHR